MLIGGNFHLTYCTNIHPGETWNEIFYQLKKNVPAIKQKVSTDKSFGIGLRLSDIASRELSEETELKKFKRWLTENNLYVFTMNSFVFGGFHTIIVKEKVHFPDWTTQERVDYTMRMFKILSKILPDGIEGGISTSPLSYKFWHKGEKQIKNVFKKSSENIRKVANELKKIKHKTGKILHLDIEPEPDGLIENSDETIQFFKKYLCAEQDEIIREHIRICYDVCHFAVEYEKPEEALKKFSEAGIKIGKVQISSALKIILLDSSEQRKKVTAQLKPFAESTYLHQTVEWDSKNKLHHYPDLPDALANIFHSNGKEWRIHYHVPVFMKSYSEFQSTQDDITEVLQLLKKNNFTNHLETETYTWEVLPQKERQPLNDSIVRELEWVKENMK